MDWLSQSFESPVGLCDLKKVTFLVGICKRPVDQVSLGPLRCHVLSLAWSLHTELEPHLIKSWQLLCTEGADEKTVPSKATVC